MLPYAEAAVVATTIQAFLFGLYFITFLLCLRWLTLADDGLTVRKDIEWPMLTVTIIFFALSVIVLALCLETTLLAPHPLISMGIVIWVLEASAVIIADAVLIYRCWVVYDKSWPIVALPILLSLFCFPAIIMFVYWGTTNLPVITKVHFTRMKHIREVSYISTIVIHVYTTSAIIFRIWRNITTPGLLYFAIHNVADSGLLYIFTSVSVRVCSLLIGEPPFEPYTPQILATAINTPVIGIAFNLILIRRAQRRVSPGNSTTELYV